jgi:hypothetical protein
MSHIAIPSPEEWKVLRKVGLSGGYRSVVLIKPDLKEHLAEEAITREDLLDADHRYDWSDPDAQVETITHEEHYFLQTLREMKKERAGRA